MQTNELIKLQTYLESRAEECIGQTSLTWRARPGSGCAPPGSTYSGAASASSPAEAEAAARIAAVRPTTSHVAAAAAAPAWHYCASASGAAARRRPVSGFFQSTEHGCGAAYTKPNTLNFPKSSEKKNAGY